MQKLSEEKLPQGRVSEGLSHDPEDSRHATIATGKQYVHGRRFFRGKSFSDCLALRRRPDHVLIRAITTYVRRRHAKKVKPKVMALGKIPDCREFFSMPIPPTHSRLTWPTSADKIIHFDLLSG
jgi:hypothetical protein